MAGDHRTGSEALAELTNSAADMEYQTLISLMLWSQTKDTVNAATMLKLRAHGLHYQLTTIVTLGVTPHWVCNPLHS